MGRSIRRAQCAAARKAADIRSAGRRNLIRSHARYLTLLQRIRRPARASTLRGCVNYVVPLLVVLALHLLSAPVSAQEIEGRLVGTRADEPVERAIVRLLDENSTRVAAALSDGAGRFTLEDLAPGIYRVRVSRLGYSEWTSEALELREGHTMRRKFRIPTQPVRMPEIGVEGERRCRTDPASARKAREVYDRVRPELRAIAEVERSGRFSFVMDLVRESVVQTNLVRQRYSHRRDSATVRVTRPIATLAPDELLRGGYARPDTSEDSYGIYYAPDAGALASEEFLLTHCFEMAEAADGDSVGIAFSPIPGREVVDVEGVLWVEGNTHRPIAVDYDYTRVREFMKTYVVPLLRTHIRGRYENPWEVRIVIAGIQMNHRAGGRVEFETVREGLPVTVRWRQWVPILSHSGTFGGGFGAHIVPKVRVLEHEGRVLALAPASRR